MTSDFRISRVFWITGRMEYFVRATRNITFVQFVYSWIQQQNSRKNNDGKVLMIMNKINRILYSEKSLSIVRIDQENSW